MREMEKKFSQKKKNSFYYSWQLIMWRFSNICAPFRSTLISFRTIQIVAKNGRQRWRWQGKRRFFAARTSPYSCVFSLLSLEKNELYFDVMMNHLKFALHVFEIRITHSARQYTNPKMRKITAFAVLWQQRRRW